MIDGPNITGYDNTAQPNPLYALVTNIVGPAIDRQGSGQPVCDRVIIGSDPLALGMEGAEMKKAFAENKIEAELYYRVVQAG